ncbi:hypothetical protein [Rufibacter psychrotolerans]|uniref:hypothetical protein n=1 Tax=Rufibacter psychrotolerans TaxID=2812556 RepID=UPI001966F9AF|nr:hypothetical protein [Rufibacter sp. SYSU D00308]
MQFSLKRFGWLFRKHTAEHYKYYLMSAGVLMGITAFITLFLIFAEDHPFDASRQQIIFLFLLLATGTIFTSTIFAHLGDKRKAIAALTLPASHFEKFLVAWLYSFVFFQLVYIGCFYLVLLVVLPMDDWRGGDPEYMTLFSSNGVSGVALIMFLFLHSITFLGSVFFEKWHFIKTAFAFILLGFAIVTLNTGFWQSIVGAEGDVGQVGPFENLNFMQAGKYYTVQYPHDNELLMVVALMGTALLVWAAAYHKLREKEV